MPSVAEIRELYLDVLKEDEVEPKMFESYPDM